MTGRLIAVVGPSGVGKDSVMAAMAARRPDLHLVRRVITRPADAGGEPFEGVDEATFAARSARGDFALEWRAHGLGYGIPASVDAVLDTGRDALANLSRGVLVAARACFGSLVVLSLTAAPGVLAARLADRGREGADDIARRLDRPARDVPAGLPLIAVANDGPLDATAAVALARLYPVNATRCS